VFDTLKMQTHTLNVNNTMKVLLHSYESNAPSCAI